MAKRSKTFSQRSRETSSASKAAFHHLAGAGKSRVVRPFFDLTEQDLDLIEERIGRHLDLVVSRPGEKL